MFAKSRLKFLEIVLLAMLFADSLSFLLSAALIWQNLLWALIVAATMIFSLKDLRWGFYVVVGELLIGSQGHLFNFIFNGTQISLRMGLFAAVLLAWLVGAFHRRYLEFFKSQFFPYYAGLSVFIILGVAAGLLNNPTVSWFSDFNGWLFFLLAPVAFAVASNLERVRQMMVIFFAGVVFLSGKTFLLLIVFAHSQPEFISRVYHWLRGSLLAEPTFIAGDLYRIFMQSQVYELAGLSIFFVLLLFGQRLNIGKKSIWLGLGLSALTLLISLSRSFWLGALAGLVFAIVYLLFRRAVAGKIILANSCLMLAIFAVLALLLQALTGNFVQAALGARWETAMVDPAGQSRLLQLQPLLKQIKAHPFIGSGFGAQVSYYSSDPRVLTSHPDGLYTTYAFEWGYLDIWLKIGLFGLLAYLLLLFKIGHAGLTGRPLNTGLIAGLAAMAAASVFSPYLNHPLGIGYLLVTSAIINANQLNNNE